MDFNAIFSRIGPRPGTGKEFHLDHIIPLSAFDLDIELHVKLANSPCNLRWITKKENLEKSATIPDFAYENQELRAILQQIGKI